MMDIRLAMKVVVNHGVKLELVVGVGSPFCGAVRKRLW